MHVYVFIRQAHEAIMRNLAGRHEVGFLTRTTGAYAAFATLSVESLQEPARLLVELSDGSPVVAETAIALDPPWLCIHPMVAPRMVEGYVQIHVDRLRQIPAVRQELLALDLTMAATIVAGNFDILLHLGADTLPEVERALLYELPSVSGIASMSVGLASLEEAERDTGWFWTPPEDAPGLSYKMRLQEEAAARARAREEK